MKKITSGRYGKEIIKLNKLIIKLTKKYLAAQENPNLSKEQVEAIAEEGLRIINEQNAKVDEIKKLIK